MGKRRLVVLVSSCVLMIVFMKAIFHCHLDPSDDSFTSVELCPACYGSNLCPQFYHGDISLFGASKLKYLQFMNQKNVYKGKLQRDRVILKKLAHDWEIIEGDKSLCENANLGKSCKVSDAVKLLVQKSILPETGKNLLNVLSTFKIVTDISHCPSARLMKYMFYKMNTGQIEFLKSEDLHDYKVGEMMYSLLINPEAIILQAFSQTEGWPFPHYYGACGRVIVEEYAGRPLAYFEDSSWEQRLDIAYQLLQISQMLTENSLEFALYMTDVNMDNFAVRPDGNVLLIDVENIVIVDRLQVQKEKSYVAGFHESKGKFCKDCLSFSYEELCSHDLSDHNYYAICRGILVPNSYYSAKGLLHDIPQDINVRTNLTALLKECAEPSTEFGRFHVVPKILQVMKSLL